MEFKACKPCSCILKQVRPTWEMCSLACNTRPLSPATCFLDSHIVGSSPLLTLVPRRDRHCSRPGAQSHQDSLTINQDKTHAGRTSVLPLLFLALLGASPKFGAFLSPWCAHCSLVCFISPILPNWLPHAGGYHNTSRSSGVLLQSTALGFLFVHIVILQHLFSEK